MSPEKKRAILQHNHPELSTSQQCKLVQLGRSAVYYTPAGIDVDTLAMMKESDRVFTKYPFFGSRHINACYTPRRRHSALGRKSPVAVERKVAQTSTWGGMKTGQVQPWRLCFSGNL